VTDIIFDANCVFARAYFAFERGESTGDITVNTPVELAVKMVLNLVNPHSDKVMERIDRMLFCWDGKPKTDKKRPTPKRPDYEEMRQKFQAVLTPVFGAAHGHSPEHEADDAVATAVYRDSVNKQVVVTSDKDLQQLCSTNTRVYSLSKNMLLTREQILSRWNVKRPSQVAIAQAIIGDPGDGIRGVTGWGPGKVKKLFAAVTAEMNLDQAIDVVDASMSEAQKLEFYSALKVTMLNCDVPGIPDPAPLTFASPKILGDLGLESIIGQYSRVMSIYDPVSMSEALDAIDSV
jgi:5'-3' exonuclease